MGRFGLPFEVASIVEMLVTNEYMTNKVGTTTVQPIDGMSTATEGTHATFF